MQVKGGIAGDDFINLLQSTDAEAGVLLRGYVDEWLQSGFDGETEEPLNRSLGKAPNAERAFHRYISEHPPKPVMTGTGYYLHFGISHLYSADRAPENYAAFAFASLMDPDNIWRDRLFKCRRCGAYGLLEKRPRRLYKRGIKCKRCRHKATADTSTAKSRRERREKRLDETAAAWRAWKPTCRLPRKEWVAVTANRRLAVHDRITKKWVSRFQSKIEAKANAEVEP
jgi:hypothetical protein